MVSREESTSADVAPAPATENGLIRAHGMAALGMLVYTSLLGVAVAVKFHAPEFLGSEPWLTWGRMRPGHIQAMLFGWLGNAFLMFLYYAVPRLAGRPATGRALGWALFVVWNVVAIIPGLVLIAAGRGQWLEWAEFPIVVDGFVILGFVLTAAQFVAPLLKAKVSELYVSAWYILGALVFTTLAYPVGNFMPELVPGARGATYSGLWIHDAVGLYVTPLAVAIAYFVIPATTGRPIYSHFLSMVAFWMLFFVYPLNGTHHYLFSSIPMDAQLGAVVASIYLGMDVVLNVANQLLSLRGAGGLVARNPALRYTWTGIVAYLVVSLQGSLQAIMPVNRLVHFSDWVIGHSHLAMIGFASFAAIGGMLHVWERTPGVRYNARAAEWSFWLTVVGLLGMFVDLTAAGLTQGALWRADVAWMDSVRASRGYWITRTGTGLLTLAGFLALVAAMTTGPVGRAVAPGDEPLPDDLELDAPALDGLDRTEIGRSWLENAYVLTSLAGIGFFVFSFVVLAVWPNEVLRRTVSRTAPTGLSPARAIEARGRAVYGREGCAYCHSQLVRFTADDVRRFGRPSEAWESDRDYPQLWGTRRIGPDLARESGRKSRDWHFAHLWNPRHVVPDSNMPGYPWLFDGSASNPTRAARDLVAYLDTLGRDARLAGVGPSARSLQTDPVSGEWCGPGESVGGLPSSAPAPLFAMPREPSERLALARHGADVFARNCRGCHGPDGRGDGPAAPTLRPSPRDLSTARFSDRHLSDVLWHGVPGSSMPGWSDLSTRDLRALAAYVAAREAVEPEPVRASTTSGKSLYEKHCVVCHGLDGGGSGLSARVLAPRPTNFREVRPSLRRAESALALGVAGTAMPPWSDRLSVSERRSLAEYVQTFHRPEAP